ncbi:Panacea domain-containing protein [Lactococcus garvieae]|uniref:Panacea domain-containing protein n=1 Tax=Lactococcus garvieae TaxID=1363 RepID=UPI001F6055F8|nr:Panacea domain-containing protein [Lactococcus garvieae]MCI3860123.1 SocA family protein [Lactococcus garvieae]
MYKSMDIADYFITKANDMGQPLDNLRLQKYLYYFEAMMLVEVGTPLIEEDFEKWQYGPVLPSVYYEYKQFGNADILKPADHFIIEDWENLEFRESTFDITDFENNIPNDDKELIEQLIKILNTYGTFELVNMTHEHDEWKNAEDDILSGTRHLIYNQEKIKQYFEQNPKAQIWKNKHLINS